MKFDKNKVARKMWLPKRRKSSLNKKNQPKAYDVVNTVINAGKMRLTRRA